MDKLQKILVIFLLLASIGVAVFMVKAVKVFVEKKEEIGELSLTKANLTKERDDLTTKLGETEKELTQTKLNLEDTSYKLEEEKKKCASFNIKYETEKARANKLETNLDRTQLALKQEQKKKENLSSELEKVKEERRGLSQDLKEVRQAKEALESFVAEVSTEVREESALGKIIKIYPQGLLGIELEKDSYDRREANSLIVGKREVKLAGILNYLIILDTGRGADIGGLKDGDSVEYKYHIREVAPGKPIPGIREASPRSK